MSTVTIDAFYADPSYRATDISHWTIGIAAAFMAAASVAAAPRHPTFVPFAPFNPSDPSSPSSVVITLQEAVLQWDLVQPEPRQQ